MNFTLWAVSLWRWDPGLFLSKLFNHAILCVFSKSKFDFFEIIFTGETASIKDFIVTRREFDSIATLHSADEIFILILLKGVG